VRYDKIDWYFKEQDLVRSSVDYNLYYSIQDGKLVIIVLWVVTS
jgi:hypothetical protein